MRIIRNCAWLLTSLAALRVAAIEVELNQKPDSQEQCSGMYSRKAWGGSVDPYIDTKFLPYTTPQGQDPIVDPTVAFLIFEWQDEGLIGVPDNEDEYERVYICDQNAINGGYCTTEEYGSFILAVNATELSKNPMISKAIHLAEDLPPMEYPILKTGYYCVLTAALDSNLEYTGIAEFRNAYGELPGAQIAKLPFYGGLAIVYAVIGLYWGFLYAQNRHDILPVQNYITATIVFLIFEMITTWGYYDHMNRKGSDVMSKVLLILVSILNAARNSISFFLLLIVCLGYGVVRSNLGRKMLWARILAATHFVFGVIYAIASLTIAPEDVGPLILLVVMPLAASLTAFYIWTLNALAWTLKDLQERKQRVKAQMYRKLWYCIVATILVIFAFFFFNSFTFAGSSNPNYTPAHWQTRWFILDGWLNIVYLADVAFIAYLWRPTANNRRFAMSEEISQDDEGFDLASPGRDSLDFDALDQDDPSDPANNPSNNAKPPSYFPSTTTNNNNNQLNGHSNGDLSKDLKTHTPEPLPAPMPTRPQQSATATTLQSRQRDRDMDRGRDGEEEAMFAVGDDEEDDDDDADDVGEGRKVRGFSDSEEEEEEGLVGGSRRGR